MKERTCLITCLECIQPIPLGEEVVVKGLRFCKKCAKEEVPACPHVLTEPQK